MIDQKNQLGEVAQCQKYSKTATEVEKKWQPFGKISILRNFTHMARKFEGFWKLYIYPDQNLTIKWRGDRFVRVFLKKKSQDLYILYTQCFLQLFLFVAEMSHFALHMFTRFNTFIQFSWQGGGAGSQNIFKNTVLF